ncbi:hypothetical protein OH491_02160 [Termitidicoccus mucosus]|uniref:Uncharacterized protein n=1 Tax=Termitidicoccus mucosus TaxID=1184151 RepID=A0A178ILH5_9BACT|nr:hypothetical protein AW736_07395 [Opitutaceae bacterium TSB47]
MDSHDVVKQILKEIPAKQIAAELGVSLSLVYKWAEPPLVGSGASNPLDRTEVLTRISGSIAPLEWLCARMNGTFVPGAPPEVPELHVHRIGPELVRELGRLLGELSETATEGDIGKAKIKSLRKQWEHVKKIAEMYVQAAEKGRLKTIPTNSKPMP